MFEKKYNEKKERSTCKFPHFTIAWQDKDINTPCTTLQIRFLSLNFNSSQFPFRFLEIVCIHRRSIKIMEQRQQQPQLQQQFWWEIFFYMNSNEEISRLHQHHLCLCVSRVYAVECRYSHCFACAADFLTFFAFNFFHWKFINLKFKRKLRLQWALSRMYLVRFSICWHYWRKSFVHTKTDSILQ